MKQPVQQVLTREELVAPVLGVFDRKGHRDAKAFGEHLLGLHDALKGMDVIGRDYWDANLRSLATAGRLVLVGLMGGAQSETNLGLILSKRLQIFGTVMRSRPLIDRAAITRDYQLHLEPAIVNGEMKPVIDRVFPLSQAAAAHQYMAENRNFGKILLDCIEID